jgi:4-hydroxythreonine-4-phosphate dehydrogenase
MIGISLGDMTGIGPEVTLKALAALQPGDGVEFLLIGDVERTRELNARLGLNLSLELLGEKKTGARLFLHDPFLEILPAELPTGSPVAARAAIASLTYGAQRCLRGELDGLVTAPVNKESILRSGQAFVGQTEFLSQLAGTHRTAMMLLGHDDRGRWLRVVLATTHLPLAHVARELTTEKILLAITLAAQSCRDLGLPRARIGVCGLNPHAGEGGKLGDEERTIIAPAVAAARTQGVDVAGPISADALFHSAFRGNYETVIAMYHDQGLAPLKMVAFESGVNWTLGLPFVRTSPDHGTAYDIAGRGVADAGSMMAAIELCRALIKKA